ncbi:hypothetical protein K2173_003785 [Erythroxylum novogranatense]|uniref:Uncharacterized protein n=1 Tax=Erythroxylum novogranatense TaxID=1862640 RepID=A0AAV8SIV3_9ROSI|nr:hypothetical protein K2173_003785 [Erythroxylum novogranatense]
MLSSHYCHRVLLVEVYFATLVLCFSYIRWNLESHREMANVENKTLQESIHMTGGDGPCSYTQNSSFQKEVVDATKGIVMKGITETIDFKSPCFDSWNKVVIADFGCSAGPNTFIAVKNMIESVELKYRAQKQGSSPLEFQVFFNDLTGNDFNTLFKALPSYQKYYAAGVPGSFFVRLFPKSSLHIAHSSYALHWLSRVPRQVVDPQSPAWNKGSIHCTGHDREVRKAYLAQFLNGMDDFLAARAQEIVGGGLMIIHVPGLPEGVLMSQTNTGRLYDFLGLCLADLAKMGVLNQEKVDSFNLPLYYSTVKEWEEIIIERNRCFTIESMKTWTHPMLHGKPSSGESGYLQFRAIFEGILKQHFGEQNVVDQIFSYLVNKFAESSSMFDGLMHNQIDICILLKRKIINVKLVHIFH